MPEGCLLLRMQATLGTHWRLPGEPLRQLGLGLVTACRHSSGSPLNCLLRQGCWDTTIRSLPLLLLLLEVGPLQLLWSSGLLLRHRAGLLLLLLWLLLWRVRWADQRPLGCVRVLGRWFHDGLWRWLSRSHTLRTSQHLLWLWLLLTGTWRILWGCLLLLLLRLLLSSHLTLDSLLELLSRHSGRHALTLLHLLNEHLLLRMPQQLSNSRLAAPGRLLCLRLLLLLRLLEVLHRLLASVHSLLELLHGKRPLLLLLLPLEVLHQNLLLLRCQVTHLQLALAYLHDLLRGQL